MKLRNKLILSCAALAAVATTAVSTTYAWYTSNTDVSASGVQASTLAGSDKLLLISASGQKGTWGSSITLTNNATFDPVSYEGGSYYLFNQTLSAGKAGPATDADHTVTVDPTQQTTSGSVLNYNIYLRNGGSSAFNVKVTKFSIKNTTGTLPSKTILKANSGCTNSLDTTGATYTVDLMRALVVRVRKATVTGDTGTGGYTASDLADLSTGTGAAASNLYNLDNYKTYADGAGANDNAHTYYEAVTGKTLVLSNGTTTNTANTLTEQGLPVTDAQSDAKTGAWDIGTIPAANEDPSKQDYVVYNFQVFLNGWDLYCFDAVQGQNITIDMAFSVVQSA